MINIKLRFDFYFLVKSKIKLRFSRFLAVFSFAFFQLHNAKTHFRVF